MFKLGELKMGKDSEFLASGHTSFEAGNTTLEAGASYKVTKGEEGKVDPDRNKEGLNKERSTRGAATEGEVKTNKSQDDGKKKKKKKKKKNKKDKKLPRGLVEAVVAPANRPALLVNNNSAPEPAAFMNPWAQMLSDSPKLRKRLQQAILATGRIDLNGSHQGTGWLMLEPWLVVTNSHVAEVLVERHSDYTFLWTIRQNVTINFQASADEEARLPISEVIHIDRVLDVAFLRLATPSSMKPLTFSTTPISKDEPFFLVGFPGEPDPEALSSSTYRERVETIFEGVYSVKRVSPGEVARKRETHTYRAAAGHPNPPNTTYFEHDATTLPGSSGSILLSANSLKVVGLHFAGEYRHANWAHHASAVWLLWDKVQRTLQDLRSVHV